MEGLHARLIRRECQVVFGMMNWEWHTEFGMGRLPVRQRGDVFGMGR